MKKNRYLWITITVIVLLTLIGIPYFFANQIGPYTAPFYGIVVESGTICFLGILGLFAWLEYMDSKKSVDAKNNMADLKNELGNLQEKIKRLSADVEQLKSNSVKIEPPPEKRLMDIAEKLRTKSTREVKPNEPIREILDEVPPEILKEILVQLKTIFNTTKNTPL
jgi:hypothetical protein